MKKNSVSVEKKVLINVTVTFSIVVAAALFLSGCPKNTSQDKTAREAMLDELMARNMELEKRVTELERRVSMLESTITRMRDEGNRLPVTEPRPLPGSGGINERDIERGGPAPADPQPLPAIPPPPNLTVVKVKPTNDQKAAVSDGSEAGGANGPDDETPSLFGDDPGFEYSGSGSYGNSSDSYYEDYPNDNSSNYDLAEGKGVPVEGATMYESALGQYRRGNYDLAAEAFMLYITKYPDTMYESAALFYLGECKAKLGKHREAVEQFRRYLMKYPEGPEAPMVLLEMGISFLRLQDRGSAERAFRQCIDRFPDSAAAASAKEELENLI